MSEGAGLHRGKGVKMHRGLLLEGEGSLAMKRFRAHITNRAREYKNVMSKGR